MEFCGGRLWAMWLYLIMSTTKTDLDVSSSVTCSEDEVVPSSEESIPQTETTPRRDCRRSAKSAAPLAKRLARKFSKSRDRTSTPSSYLLQYLVVRGMCIHIVKKLCSVDFAQCIFFACSDLIDY